MYMYFKRKDYRKFPESGLLQSDLVTGIAITTVDLKFMFLEKQQGSFPNELGLLESILNER